jgi:DNA-binding transcriptional ArsR family regulator
MSRVLNKNIQTSQLLVPKLIFDKKNINFQDNQNIFNLIQFNDNQNHKPFPSPVDFGIPNYNDKPPQPIRYQHIETTESDELSISIKDLRNNDKKILTLLSEEIWSSYSFKAIERKLEIHQQSLSRALKRLLDLKLIEKTPIGYKIIENDILYPSIAVLQNDLQQEEEEDRHNLQVENKKTKKRFNQLIQIRIPIKSNIDSIINHLIRKWFGNLRWYGLIKKETGIILQWTAISKYNENNKLFQINLNIVSEYIVIESDATSDKDKVHAISYSNRLVEEITKILKNNLEKQDYERQGEFESSKVPYSAPTAVYTNKVNGKSKNKK